QLGFVVDAHPAGGSMQIDLDGVALHDPAPPGPLDHPTAAQQALERRLFARPPSVTTYAARPIESASAGDTGWWALGGAALGLLAAAAGLAAAVLARGRRVGGGEGHR